MNVLKPKKVPLFRTISCGALGGMLAWLVGCAGQVAPSGGPPDTVPPAILRTYPDSNATRVTPDHIELEFAEYVERRSVEEAIFVSPYLGKLEFDWSGTEVTIRFPESLRQNTTYVLTVGTDVVDIRANNRMAHAYTLAFSTGDSIDRGVIRGRVFDEKPDGIMIFAYVLTGLLADTLDPTHTRPHYIVQTGSDGTFALKNIAFASYRVIAVRDEYRNLFYDREVDQFGVSTLDPVITPDMPEYGGLSFRMSKEDTTRPFLASVSALDQKHLLLRFSEPVDTLSTVRAAFSLADTATGKGIAIGSQSQDMGNLAVVRIELGGVLDSMGAYRVTVRGIVDLSGNALDTNNASLSFNGPTAPDTLRAYPVVRGLADSVRGVQVKHVFAIDFGRPVDLGGVLRGIVLRDSAGNTVPAEVRPRTPAEVFVVPTPQLKPLTWYSLRVILDSVRDARGTGYRDSTVTLHFQTEDSRLLGTIEGTVSGHTGGHGVVVAVRSTDANPRREHTVRTATSGKFVVSQLPEGRYGIEAFEDADGDGRYRAGLPHPFLPSARFAVYPDTVRVRARWSVEGVNLRLK